MKTIVAATDFSPASLNAADYAAEMASLLNAGLVLFHVYHVPTVTSSEVPMIVPELDEIEAEGMAKLEELRKTLAKKFPGLALELKCVCGFAAEEIGYLVPTLNADLVVMGMRGAGRLEEKLLGSVTTSVIHRKTCPVLSVSENVRFRAPKKIVLATDFSKLKSDTVLNPLKDITGVFKSKIYVLNVVKEAAGVLDISQATEGVRLDHFLEEFDHSFFEARNDDVMEGINDFVKSHDIDMVVMIPGRHSLLESLFRESNTKQMAYHSALPMLTLVN